VSCSALFSKAKTATVARARVFARQPIDRLPSVGEPLLDLMLLIKARSPRSMSMLRTGRLSIRVSPRTTDALTPWGAHTPTTPWSEGFPNHITIPVVVAVGSECSTNYAARRVIVATAPDGERVGTLEFAWGWPDNPPQNVEFRVFAQHLPMRVQSEGIYSVGLYDSLHRTETEHMFPVPVLKRT